MDALSRFIFEHLPVRGGVVRMESSYREVLARRDYPPVLQTMLGELLAAGTLMAANLKFRGSLVFQLQGSGPVTLLVVEVAHDLGVRAMAKWDGDLPDSADLRDLAGNARFVVTLDPKDGSQVYQGIIALEAGSIAHLLENYLARSEQLQTRIWLTADGSRAAGLLLQKMPDEGGTAPGGEVDADAWNRLTILADTVKPEELLQLTPGTLLGRLFAEETVRLFDAQPTRFFCHCSRERVSNALRLLGRSEVEDVLDERGEIEVNCDFCNQRYRFDRAGVQTLFAQSYGNESTTRH